MAERKNHQGGVLLSSSYRAYLVHLNNRWVKPRLLLRLCHLCGKLLKPQIPRLYPLAPVWELLISNIPPLASKPPLQLSAQSHPVYAKHLPKALPAVCISLGSFPPPNSCTTQDLQCSLNIILTVVRSFHCP